MTMSLSQLNIDIDEAEAVVLQESLLKTQTLINSISKSLQTISRSGAQSEKLLSPILSKHKRITTFKKNVDDSLLVVSNVQGIASEAAVYESRLSQRTVENVKQYITTIHKAEDVLQKLSLSADNIEFKGISENLQKTIGESEWKLKQLFKDLLSPIANPFDPQRYLTDRKPFPYLDDSKIKDITQILNYFQENEKPLDLTYIEHRSRVVDESLAILAPFTQHFKKTSKVPYEKGTNGINNYAEALIGFIANEYALLEDLFRTDDRNVINSLFLRIFEPMVLLKFIKIVNGIIDVIKTNLSNDGLLVFEIIDNVVKVQTMLGSTIGQEYLKLDEVLSSCRVLARTLFRELLVFTEEKVKSQETTLPQDNGICQVTVEVMSKARRFAEYKDGVLDVMRTLRAGSWIPTPRPQWIVTFSSISQTTAIEDDNPNELLSSFFSDVIDALMVNLEIKALHQQRKKQNVGYFLITNLTLVEQIISRSDLSSIIDSSSLTRIEKLKKRAMNLFLTQWKQMASLLLDVTPTQGKLTTKEKDAIKDKFRTFNTELEECIRQYKQYNITDATLRKYLAKEIGFIIPLYNRFYDKYVGAGKGNEIFTKHLEKYVKWDKTQFDRLLEGLGR
ncbi:hypothetical protein WICPIJ_003288 [Wickerhamomyces pijperi]|uniref:Exocyst complex protein EXO70 n=1 Tax=Wickerhamomyces pijperi TaxID=599730 RepID=A0A9P8QA78_WICPI|nr:hypothetical protein WICPIJ_003288 [Wickerhamomyces pijperi]